MDSTNRYFLWLGILVGIILMCIATYFICMQVIKHERYTQKMKEVYPGYSKERKKEKFEPYYMRDLNREVAWMNWWPDDVSKAYGVIDYCEYLKREHGSFLRKEDVSYLDSQIISAKGIIATKK